VCCSKWLSAEQRAGKAAQYGLAEVSTDEIDKVAQDPVEDESLAAEHALLVNADKLFQLSSQAYSALYEAESSTTATLKQARRQVEELQRVDRCAASLEQLQRLALPWTTLRCVTRILRARGQPRAGAGRGAAGGHPAIEAQIREHGQRNTHFP
jgi:DNA repair ATPase RecN